MNREARFQRILGVRFFVGSVDEAIEEITRDGGVVVVPAAPALKNLTHDLRYREALLGADFAIADSAFMVLLWNLIQRDNIPKISGLKYLRALIEREDLHGPGRSFWVMPSPVSAQRSVIWLQRQGIQLSDDDIHLAPMYGETISDAQLLRRIEERRPDHIVLGLGGGTQERLGLYLKQNLSYRPAVHCIGAAIAFLSGDQVRIPGMVDHMGFGWLWRCFSDPRRFIPRYWDARYLAPLMIRYRDRLPVTHV